MKNTMYFKSQEELEAYFGGPDKIPSNVLAIVGEPTGDEPAEYVLYTVSNNQSITGTMQEQGGYVTDPADHEKIVQLQEDVAYLDENKADKTQLADYVSYAYLSNQDYASEAYVANYVSEHAGPVDLSAYVTKDELSNASYATTSYVQDKIDAIPAVDLTGYATEAYVTNKIGDLVNSAPETLDTLQELSYALGNDPNFATTIATELGTKANADDVYTKAEIQAMGYISSIPSEYVTETEISAMGYITVQDVPAPDLSAYVTKVELEGMSYITINDVPAQVQADWNETDSSYASYISNKPTIPIIYKIYSGKGGMSSIWATSSMAGLGSLNIAGPQGNTKAEVWGDYSFGNGVAVKAAGKGSHAEGWKTEAIGDYSHAEGKMTHAMNTYTHSEGYFSYAGGPFAHAEGKYTYAYNEGELSTGNYNISTYTSSTFGDAGNTSFTHGIGEYNNRKNAIEIMQNGDLYAYGVGNYDGTNFSSAYTLAYVINDIQTNLGAAASVAEMILGE